MRLRLPRRRPTGWFLAATILAAVAGLATLRAAAANVPTTNVVIASRDLPVGTRIGGSDADLGVRPIPSDGVLPGMVTTPDDLAGRVLAVPVSAGEPVTHAAVGGVSAGLVAPLAAGERAVSVPLATAGAAAAILVAGVHVDVVASPAGAGGDARVVVSDAEVMAQTTPPGTDPGSFDGGAVLVRVSEADALRLSAALDSAGGIRLLARPVAPTPEGTP